MRVLVVEDDPIYRANLLDRLLLAGMDVVCAPNAPIGMAFANDDAQHLDAAVVDLHLGDQRIGGAEIARSVSERHPNAKIVVISGRYDLLDLRWMSQGWTLMPKPFRLRALADHLMA